MAGQPIDMNISVKVDDTALKKLVRDALAANKSVTKAFKKSGIDMNTVVASRQKAIATAERVQKQMNQTLSSAQKQKEKYYKAVSAGDTKSQNMAKQEFATQRQILTTQQARVKAINQYVKAYDQIIRADVKARNQQGFAQSVTGYSQKQSNSKVAPWNVAGVLHDPISGTEISDKSSRAPYVRRINYMGMELKALNEKWIEYRTTQNDIRSGTDKTGKAFDKTSESINKGRKNTDFWNSSFTKFSVIMSGIAATLFVFQQVAAWIGAAITKLSEFEKAALKIESVVGNNSGINTFLSNLQKTSSIKVETAGSAFRELSSMGYSPSTIQRNLKKAIGYTETGFVNLADAMEIATTDAYNLSEKMDYYSKKNIESAENFWKRFGNLFDSYITNTMRVLQMVFDTIADSKLFKAIDWVAEGFSDFFLGAFKYGLMKADQESKKLVSTYRIGKGGNALKVGEEDTQMIYDPITIRKTLEDLYKRTGFRIEEDFKNLFYAMQLKQGKERGIYAQVGTSTTEKLKLRKAQKEEDWNLKWDRIEQVENPLTPADVKRLQNTFKETNYYDPKLKFYDDFQRQRRYGVETQTDKGTKLDFENEYGASFKSFSETLKIWSNEMKMMAEQDKDYFEKTSIMTPEYKKYRKEEIENQYIKDTISKDTKAEEKRNEALIQLTKDTNQRMFEDQQYLFERVKKVSEEYYTAQKTLITDERDHWIETGYDKVAMQQMYVDRMQDLNDQYYRTVGQGMESTIQDFADNTRDNLEIASDVTKTFFNGMENALVDFTHTGELSFSNMIQSMLDDLLRFYYQMAMFGGNGQTGIAQGLFDGVSKLFNPTTGGSVGSISGSGWIAPGKMSMANGGYIGETVRGIGTSGQSYEFHGNEFVVPSKGLGGSNVEITINEAPPGTTVKKQQQGDVTQYVVNLAAADVANHGSLSRTLESTYGLSRVGRRA